MKKEYEQPRLEVAEFCFSEHIAASGTECLAVWTNVGVQSCTSGTPELVTVNN